MENENREKKNDGSAARKTQTFIFFILFGEGILRTEHFAFDVIHEKEKDRQGHDDNIKHETKSQLET